MTLVTLFLIDINFENCFHLSAFVQVLTLLVYGFVFNASLGVVFLGLVWVSIVEVSINLSCC